MCVQKTDYPQGIPECGTDALRFALVSYTAQGQPLTSLLHLSFWFLLERHLTPSTPPNLFFCEISFCWKGCYPPPPAPPPLPPFSGRSVFVGRAANPPPLPPHTQSFFLGDQFLLDRLLTPNTPSLPPNLFSGRTVFVGQVPTPTPSPNLFFLGDQFLLDRPLTIPPNLFSGRSVFVRNASNLLFPPPPPHQNLFC